MTIIEKSDAAFMRSRSNVFVFCAILKKHSLLIKMSSEYLQLSELSIK